MFLFVKKTIATASTIAVVGMLLVTMCSKEAPFSAGQSLLTSARYSSGSTHVNIVNPTNGQEFLLNDTIPLSAIVSDSASDTNSGYKGHVAFYQNNVFIGTATSAPFTFYWKATKAGYVSFTARAVSDSSTSDTSNAVTILIRDAFISIASPANDTIIIPGSTIPIIAIPLNTQKHTVKNVTFYRNNNSLGTISSAPFTYTWKNAVKGAYTLKVIATDTKGKKDTSKVNIRVGNIVPSIYITEPRDSAVFFRGDTIKISAIATDSLGSIRQVIFYKNGKRIGADNTIPYNFNLYDTTLGTFTLTAKAVDNLGDTGISAPVVFIRQDGFVKLVNPRDYQTFGIGDSISITATTTNSSFHSIKNVKLYRNNTLLSTKTTLPYSFVWKNASAGTYRISAIATDTKGMLDTSNIATITVQNTPPSVYFNSPYNGQHFITGDTIRLSAFASDSDGIIASVKFYQGATLLATKTASPYTYLWQNVKNGNYSLQQIIVAHKIQRIQFQ